MEGASVWLDEIAGSGYEWIRVGSDRIETELRPGLPCRITAREINGHPVLYMAVGTNGTFHYWQTATIDPQTRQPIPKDQALGDLFMVMRLAAIVSQFDASPKLIDWATEKP